MAAISVKLYMTRDGFSQGSTVHNISVIHDVLSMTQRKVRRD